MILPRSFKSIYQLNFISLCRCNMVADGRDQGRDQDQDQDRDVNSMGPIHSVEMDKTLV